MSRRKKKRTERPAAERSSGDRAASYPPVPAESRAAEAVTTMWMLSAFNALVAQAVWVGLRFYFRAHPDAKLAALAAGLLLIVAAALSLVVLVLTPIVYRVRRVRPPAVVTLLVVLVALGPWAALVTIAASD